MSGVHAMDGPAGRESTVTGQTVFRICTLVTDWSKYEAMKRSFVLAGFDESRCRYSVYDNSSANDHDPYATITEVCQQAEEPYIICCHQDVLMDRHHGYDQLMKVIGDLDRRRPDWAVAGNAGVTDDFRYVVIISDPHQTQRWPGGFPQAVHELDENFLLIRTATRVRCSAQLRGFHLYGTDLCLNARLMGYSCHVCDFHLTHLSGGALDESYWRTRASFVDRWNREFHFLYIAGFGNPIFLSRHKLLRATFGHDRVRNALLSHSWVLSRMAPLLQRSLRPRLRPPGARPG